MILDSIYYFIMQDIVQDTVYYMQDSSMILHKFQIKRTVHENLIVYVT